MEIRLLKADEIECRVKTIKENGCSLLLYKDARVDMKILDETFGVNGWQRTHELINGNLFCNLDIWDSEKICWVRKQDVGIESMTEKEKGQASDSFKRAGFNIGIGRELYTSPFIWIQLVNGETFKKDNKFQLSPSIKFTVKTINYNENREISGLEIIDNTGKVRYSLKANKTPSKPITEVKQQSNVITPKKENKPITSPQTSTFKCSNCDDDINKNVFEFSKQKFGKPLCIRCQKGVSK